MVSLGEVIFWQRKDIYTVHNQATWEPGLTLSIQRLQRGAQALDGLHLLPTSHFRCKGEDGWDSESQQETRSHSCRELSKAVSCAPFIWLFQYSCVTLVNADVCK